MGRYYHGFASSYKSLPKPRKPLKLDKPDFRRFYLHSGGNPTAFNWLATKANFLGEMMKFFPKWEQVGYAGEDAEMFSGALTEYGSSSGSAFIEGDLPDYAGGFGDSEDELYNPEDGWEGDRGPDRGYTKAHFGGFHRVYEGSLPWGFIEGNGAENFNFHPAVSEFNHFKTGRSTWMVTHDRAQNSSYGDLISEAVNVGGLGYFSDFGIDFGEDYSSIWSGARDYLTGFGDMSYYQIVMSGYKGGSYLEYYDTCGTEDDIYLGHDAGGVWHPEGVGDGRVNGERVELVDNGGWIYEDRALKDGRGAFYIMLGVLESRRRIYQALHELVCSNQDIAHRDGSGDASPKDFDIIDQRKELHGDRNRAGGADPHNLTLITPFFFSQHAFHSIIRSYVDGGGISGRDQEAFDKFSKWIKDQVGEYRDSFGDDDDEQYNFINNLLHEFKGKAAEDEEGGYTWDYQPYVGGEWNNEKKTGWDYYSVWWGDGNPPPHLNPRAGDFHVNYILSQKSGISKLNSLGPRVDGQYLVNVNWGFDAYISLQRHKDRDVSRAVSINIINRRKKRHYKMAKKEREEMQYELMWNEIWQKRAAAKKKAERRQFEKQGLARIKKANKALAGLTQKKTYAKGSKNARKNNKRREQKAAQNRPPKKKK